MKKDLIILTIVVIGTLTAGIIGLWSFDRHVSESVFIALDFMVAGGAVTTGIIDYSLERKKK